MKPHKFIFVAAVLIVTALMILTASSPASGQAEDTSALNNVANSLEEGTGFLTTIKKFLSEIVALVSLVIGIPTAVGFARKRQGTKNNEINSKEAILEFIKENASTMEEEKLERMVSLMKNNL